MMRMVNFSAIRKGCQSSGRYIPGALLALLFFCLGGGTSALAVDLNSSWEYQLNGGDQKKTEERFLQKYHLSTGFSLTPTDAVTTGVNIAYSRYTATGLGGSNETVTPTANLQLSNDIFVATLNGTLSQNRNPTAGTVDTYSWGTSLGSNLNRPFWPTLRFYYDETGGKSDQLAFDHSESSYGSDLSWILPAGNFFYGFNQRLMQDNINLNQVDSTSHTARLETGGSLFAKRLSFKLIETFNRSSSEITIGAGGKFAGEPPDQVDYYGVVISNPAIINLPLGVPSTPLTFTSLTLPPEEAAHLGMKGVFALNGEQQVDELRVGVDPVTAERVRLGDVDLQWALYISPDNVVWTPVPLQKEIIYNIFDRYFEIAIPPLTAFPNYDYLKVVVKNQELIGLGNPSVVFDALQAKQLVSQSQSSEQTTYQTDLTLSYRITSTLRASSSLNLLIGDESSKRNLHGNLNWNPSPYAGVSLGVSDNLQQVNERPDQTDRTYSLSVPTYPLPTLSIIPGVSRFESYSDSRKTTTIDTFSLNSSAVIYPDLKTAMAFGYSNGEDEVVIGEKTERKSLYGNFSLFARLTRRLTAEMAHSYIQSFLPTAQVTQDSSLNLTYRPSDLVVTRLQVAKAWSSDDPTRIDFRLDLALLRTYNTRVNFAYRHLHAESDSDSFGLSSGWDISQIFSLQTNANYRVEEMNSWNLNLKLMMKI